uniref:Ras-GAP domain-containing protein n=1 Tax=Heterorhabditis bacteriophora TaxID=37862 RepID=A0A1I7WB84_HETBA
MAQKTSRSIGWRFQSSNKGAGLIQLNGHEIDTLDTQTLNQLALQVQDLETEDVTIFLNIVPPVEQLIQQIPYSLPLLEAIYLKCELWHSEDGRSFPAKLLNCEQLFCQLVWWTAYCEQQNHNASLNKPIPTFQELEPCVGTVISVLYRQCPGLLERAQNDRKQLTVCLESFGCHGIVDPSGASHQRQMSLRLSEVLERMKHNEKMESILEEAMNNNHLASLLRILRKRVASDRLLIGLFNAFTRAAPEDFSFNQLDPVIAKLIVVFNNAYEKVRDFGHSFFLSVLLVIATLDAPAIVLLKEATALMNSTQAVHHNKVIIF